MRKNNTTLTNVKTPLFKKNISGILLLFLLWPFGVLIRVMRNLRSPQAKLIMMLFCVYFGFVMIIPENKLGAADSARYAAELITLHAHGFSFTDIKSMFYNPNTGFTDIYSSLMTWIVSLFTDNPHWLFALFGGVFGYFYVQNLWIIFQRLSSKISIDFILFLFILSYALINPIWNINGVRFWTATQVFVFGVLKYFLQKDKKGLIWAASSILFHFSFIFPVAILLISLFLPLNLTILVIFFFATNFITLLDLSFIRKGLSFMPQVFQPKINSYTNEMFIEMAKYKSHTLLFEAYQLSIKWVLYVWIIASYIFRKNWIVQLPRFKNIFAFALFFGGFAHLATNVSSGSRFMTIVYMLFFAVFTILLTHKKFTNTIKFVKLFTVPLLLFFIIFTFRIGLERIGVLTFFGNPFLALFVNDKTSIFELIKQFF